MNIREASSKDAYGLACLRWNFHGGDAVGAKQSDFIKTCTHWFESRLGSNDWSGIVADFHDEIVGCVFMQLVEKVPSPGVTTDRWGYVTNFFVTPAYRNSGVGSELLNALVRTATQETLELLIAWPSIEAVSTYKRAGFLDSNNLHKGPGDHPPMELVF